MLICYEPLSFHFKSSFKVNFNFKLWNRFSDQFVCQETLKTSKTLSSSLADLDELKSVKILVWNLKQKFDQWATLIVEGFTPINKLLRRTSCAHLVKMGKIHGKPLKFKPFHKLTIVQFYSNGDSGQALVYSNPRTKRLELVGIVSYGPSPCGQFNKPGVYTKIGAYLDWIQRSL